MIGKVPWLRGCQEHSCPPWGHSHQGQAGGRRPRPHGRSASKQRGSQGPRPAAHPEAGGPWSEGAGCWVLSAGCYPNTAESSWRSLLRAERAVLGTAQVMGTAVLQELIP